ncbi:PepSY domain-containing protein [Gilvimarinus sp. SDUM040013]|uniref:PepSY domain-containing protein n=1 Tax=Gilvimarinus gilvus TaxID=3058038 RepID=A0ABU4RWR0_9GAMM|nr:PepSY domain-containing protein [Gilvimarinus sp. SDUM040013]MDO3385292.1 PepSY domain-containing protein [Gilvimarinus sp. SDUM040013]MDX6849275.1 PepSY domain-containing protein [Gilvimarinus sp. SDUM040013]
MIKTLTCAVFLCLLSMGTTAYAQKSPYSPPITHFQCAVSAAQAGKIASKKYGGKVIDVKVVNVKGRRAYRVKLLQKSGRIHSVIIDADSGRPLG